ncbi:MAG: tripartite tricarboxylate transporter family receptor [Hyphomicrobiales bacterium]|nr:tripartite tricarboxylate transporter family receptor [Hyphomicrobiales bacterium]
MSAGRTKLNPGRRSALVMALAAGAAIMAPHRAFADDFYAGKTIRIITSADAASTYTTYPQLVAQHMGRFIPGNPNIIVQTMPGAGGIVAANYMATIAPRDGTTIASVHDTLTMTQVLTPGDVKFDMSKFNWIGVVTKMTSTLSVSDRSPATTVEGAQKTEVILGSSGPGSITHILPQLLNHMYGTKYKIVGGYAGLGQMNMAIERNEIHGRAGSLTSWQQVSGPLAGHMVHVVQVNMARDPALPNTPLLTDFARNDREKAMLEFMSSSGIVGRSLFAPPDVPKDRVEILRKAFDAMIVDPVFLDDARKRQHDIDPVKGEVVEAAVKKTIQLPKEDAAELRSALGM